MCVCVYIYILLSWYSDSLRARRSGDRPWGPPSLLYNGYWVFPRGKVAGVWCWPPTSPSSTLVKERVELYLYSPSAPSWIVKRWNSPFIEVMEWPPPHVARVVTLPSPLYPLNFHPFPCSCLAMLLTGMLTLTTFTSYWRLGWLIKSRQLEGNTTIGGSERCHPNIHVTLSVASL